MFKRTSAINKLMKMQKRIRVVPGGTSAGKTFGILPILIDYATKYPGKEISVVSESLPHLRKGAFKDFQKIMKATQRWVEEHINYTYLKYTFTNGSYIEFFSVDQDNKVRGPRRDVLYINECNNVSFETYYQLAIRTNEVIWLDFNPTNEFWVHEELTNDPDAEWLTLTYLDNEALPAPIRNELEKAREKAKFSSYWKNWWNVYGLGKLGKLEGVIFDNWQTVDKVPPEASFIGYGIDFGYTNDPSSIVGAWEWNGTVIWDEMLYETGLTNPEIAARMKACSIGKNDYGVADSAEPKSIAEINHYGYTIKPAEKGPDSVNFGISILQEKPFLVTSRSTNMIRELRKYAWDKDRDGNSLNRPIDMFNHCIDPMRYLATMRLAKKNRPTKLTGKSKLL